MCRPQKIVKIQHQERFGDQLSQFDYFGIVKSQYQWKVSKIYTVASATWYLLLMIQLYAGNVLVQLLETLLGEGHPNIHEEQFQVPAPLAECDRAIWTPMKAGFI